KDKFVQHNPAQANRCYNYPNKADPCLLDPWPGGSPVPVTHLSGMITAYRVMPVGDALNPTPTPKLTMRTAPMGTAYDAANPPWTIIAENIEDMQLALIMYDGRICYSVDDPAQCKPSEAVAVRVTLVARS